MRAFKLSGVARWLNLNLRLPGWVPLLGDIDGRHVVPAACVRFHGTTSMSAPILEITVDGCAGTAEPRALEQVSRLFAGKPKFVFNVCFSCGYGGLLRGVYADPHSIWFNVFFGYYQIDVPKSLWDRPFGYRHAAGGALEVDQLELAAIGEADWNHFSNFLYGVPLERVQRHEKVDPMHPRPTRRVRVGQRHWDQVQVENVQVASAYTTRPDELELTPFPLLRGLWRAAFGGPRPRPAFQESFFPTTMRARILMAWQEVDAPDRDLGESVYRTFIFGGSNDQTYPERVVKAKAKARSNRGGLSAVEADALRAKAVQDNEAFLRAQNEALERLIATEFRHLGFQDADEARERARSGG